MNKFKVMTSLTTLGLQMVKWITTKYIITGINIKLFYIKTDNLKLK